MLQSQLISKTLRKAPKDAISQNQILLTRGGFIDQLMSGVYGFLPLGFRVMKKIENVIRKELAKVGVQEVSLPILHPADIWKKTGRWEEVGPELWRIKSRTGAEIALSMTHEEAMALLAAKFITKESDLPVILNQFQIKIRDEERPRAGLLRLKEFIMQDAYSFDASERELEKTYKKIFGAYQRIFKNLDLKVKAQKADSGFMGGDVSHEFKMPSRAGEDIYDGKPAIELGHTFKLGTKYSQAFNLYFKNKKGESKLVTMASYGIGLDRVMAAIVESHHDRAGIIWPKSAAPFDIHLLTIKSVDLAVSKLIDQTALKIYADFSRDKVEVLYDDRVDQSAGEKFSDSDLIGIPARLVISEKTLAKKSVELKDRKTGKIRLVKINALKTL